MDHGTIIPHLFRTEYRKIVSVLCRHFGFREMEVAEDIASETFQVAMQAWGIEGLPPNPVGWLYNTAKNKAKNHLHRDAIFREKVMPALEENPFSLNDEIDLSPQNINDSQLQMMFAVCHPAISRESQIGLALRILCGFGIDEIATAFVSNKVTINKRLFRAKEKLRDENIRIELPAPLEIDQRLDQVLMTIYLLFNEGYYSVSQNKTLRKDLCLEAMRLCSMLIENEATNKPRVNALLALMCFHASRFDARISSSGAVVLYEEQDANLWNLDLISKGGYFLKMAAQGETLSKYHLEAGIAAWHTQHPDSIEKWSQILALYDQLLEIEFSPIAALNRTYALAKTKGEHIAIAEAEKLDLHDNHFFHGLLGELYEHIDKAKSVQHFLNALDLAKTKADKQAIRKRMAR
ncbi:RNA polymerase sigma factor [Dyadobacter sp. CY326]|uniref:RNA polymerase sigma factor n=1 Tax=Dyadobacter sp. CY326 TaxID=2907300 RepID=UPI001F397B2E|nr:DUF6596 domain-containing protein [Dyadobacter sp. CY326]MCE7068422.1 RNA polymerase subunit sigma [Dyadobacter sp. CY326]